MANYKISNLPHKNTLDPTDKFEIETAGGVSMFVEASLISLLLGSKVYLALMYQSQQDPPVVTVLYNTIGNIVWTRQQQGTFYGTLANTFDSFSTLLFKGGESSPDQSEAIYVADPNKVVLETAQAGIINDGVLDASPLSILIIVFP